MKNELEFQKLKGIIVFCNKCSRNIHHKNKGKKCNHPLDKQVYKAIVRTGIGNERKTKILEARDFRTAYSEFKDFEYQVKNPHLFQKAIKQEHPEILQETMVMYIDYMRDVDVPHHMKKYLSKSYIKSTEAHFHDFLRFAKSKGIDLDKYKIGSVDDIIVGKYCNYMENKGVSNYTYNGRIKAMRTFYKYLIDEVDYNIKNVWKKVKLKSEKPTDISISAEDFYDLLSVIRPDDSFAKIGKTRRNMYRPWLRNLIKLKAFTGRRNAELFAMRWNMIHFEEGKPIYIESPNIKVNRQQNNFAVRDYQFAYIPVGKELLGLLNDLNLTENKDSKDYIIAPEVENRNDLEKQTSKYFTFFFKKLNRNYNRQLKHLRQTYITREDLFVNTKISMQHSNYRVTSKHYVDKKEVAKEMVKDGFRVFNKNLMRSLSIKKINSIQENIKAQHNSSCDINQVDVLHQNTM